MSVATDTLKVLVEDWEQVAENVKDDPHARAWALARVESFKIALGCVDLMESQQRTLDAPTKASPSPFGRWPQRAPGT